MTKTLTHTEAMQAINERAAKGGFAADYVARALEDVAHLDGNNLACGLVYWKLATKTKALAIAEAIR